MDFLVQEWRRQEFMSYGAANVTFLEHGRFYKALLTQDFSDHVLNLFRER